MRLAVLLSLVVLVACSGDSGSDDLGPWRDLACGPAAAVGTDPVTFGDAPVELARSADGWHVRAVLPAASFEDLGRGIYRAGRPMPTGGDRVKLTLAGEPLAAISIHVGRNRRAPALARSKPSVKSLRWLASQERPGGIAIGPWVYVVLPADADAPEALTYEAEIPDGGGGRLSLSGLTADGFLVPPGGSVMREVRVPEASVLRFQLLVSGRVPGGRAQLVLLDGEVELGRWERPLDGDSDPTPLSIALPAGEHRLRFRASGDAALVAVLVPRVAPAEFGRPDARPWEEARRDVLLLLADTYRADNLAAWGGDPTIAPRLNRLAAESHRFLQVRAPATWTLPSHAALFSGLYPPQCGVELEMDRLPDSAWTLAEHLADAGFRTAAVTDRGYVSRAFGMDQGFQWFDEGEVDVARTVAAVERVLAADDGRPLFLFVQSYRAHDPYLCKPWTLERLGQAYAPEHTLEDLFPLLRQAAQEEQRGQAWTGDAQAVAQDYERHYRGASADLDACFGALLDRFDDAGLRGNTVLCMTSDHGESFAEHGVMGHGSGVWDDQAHVPLLVRAPGLAPVDDHSLGSLVDLPRTLSRLAGVGDHGGWLGQDLFAPRGSPPVFSFQTRQVQGANDVAVVHRGRKLILDGENGDALRHAYDLRADPGETTDLGAQESYRDLRRRVENALVSVRAAVLGREDSTISAEHRANLDALGYGGDDDEE